MSTVSIDIRSATRRDAAAITRVHDEAWRLAYRGILPAMALERMVRRRGPTWWAAAITGSATVLVLEFNNTIAGYATLGRNRSRTLDCDGEIYELYLAPEFQGIGLGTRLFSASRHKLLHFGLKSFDVWALVDNGTACAFYKNLGGRMIARGKERFDGIEKAKVAFGWRT